MAWALVFAVMAPMFTMCAVWMIAPNNLRLHEDVFRIVAIWWITLFAMFGIWYIVRTLISIRNLGA
jgi:hypothetical protein